MKDSEKLLEYALKTLREAGLDFSDWSLGGGTVLSVKYQHRISRDIDIFINDVQHLNRLSPRLNDVNSKHIIDYVEAAAFIKSSFLAGKIDFIVAPRVTKFEPAIKEIFKQKIPVCDVVEIVTKKIFYRAEKVLPRDLFDLAKVYQSERKRELVYELAKLPYQMGLFKANLTKDMDNEKTFSKTCPELILKNGQNLVGREIDVCRQLIKAVERQQEKERQKNTIQR